MYFGRNNLTYLYTDRLITNSEPFHKRDSKRPRGHCEVAAQHQRTGTSVEDNAKLSTTSEADIPTAASLQTRLLLPRVGPCKFTRQRKHPAARPNVEILSMGQFSVPVLENTICNLLSAHPTGRKGLCLPKSQFFFVSFSLFLCEITAQK